MPDQRCSTCMATTCRRAVAGRPSPGSSGCSAPWTSRHRPSAPPSPGWCARAGSSRSSSRGSGATPRRRGPGPGSPRRAAASTAPRDPHVGRHLARGRRRARRRPGLAGPHRRRDGLPRLRTAGPGHVDRPPRERRAGRGPWPPRAWAAGSSSSRYAEPGPALAADLWDLDGLARRTGSSSARAQRADGGLRGGPDARARLRRPHHAGPRVAQVPLPRPRPARQVLPADWPGRRAAASFDRHGRVAAAAGARRSWTTACAPDLQTRRLSRMPEQDAPPPPPSEAPAAPVLLERQRRRRDGHVQPGRRHERPGHPDQGAAARDPAAGGRGRGGARGGPDRDRARVLRRAGPARAHRAAAAATTSRCGRPCRSTTTRWWSSSRR